MFAHSTYFDGERVEGAVSLVVHLRAARPQQGEGVKVQAEQAHV